MASATSVFRGQLLSTVSGFGSVITSPPVQPAGNKAQLAVLVINASASTSGTFKLQGSYDGSAWKDISSGSLTQDAFGYNQLSAAVTIDHPFVRVHASISGTNVSLLFDATIAWSQQ
jgi:hypothetical protein